MTHLEYVTARVNAGFSTCEAIVEAETIRTAGIAYADAAHIIASFNALAPLLCRMAKENCDFYFMRI